MGTQKKRIWLTISTQKTKIRYDLWVSRNKQKSENSKNIQTKQTAFLVFCFFLNTRWSYLILVFCVEIVSQIRFFWVSIWPMILEKHFTSTSGRTLNIPTLRHNCEKSWPDWEKRLVIWANMTKNLPESVEISQTPFCLYPVIIIPRMIPDVLANFLITVKYSTV